MTEVYVDFLCPYAWRGAELAAALRPEGEPFQLRHFALVEGNHPDNAKGLAWRITEQALDAPGAPEFQTGSLTAFLGAQAAARQGEEARWAYTLTLFRLRHEDKRALDQDAVRQAAEQAGLDLARFEADLADDAGLRAELRAELDAAAEVGVFGTPTYVLPGGEAAYYRFESLTREPGEARRRWDLYGAVLRDGAGIGTIKRARNRPPGRDHA